MKIYSCHTPSHEVLLRRFFLPSLPPEFVSCPNALDISGKGDFQSPEFLQSLEAKIALVLESITANRGKAIIWSDVDIIYTSGAARSVAEILADETTDIWFQKENLHGSREINAGLALMRCTAPVEQLYRDCLSLMRRTGEFNDQHALNELLEGGADVSWGYLPPQFAARSHGWPPARDLVAYHANCTAGPDGVGQKMRQFHDLRWVRRLGAPYAQYMRLRREVMRTMAKFRACF